MTGGTYGLLPAQVGDFERDLSTNISEQAWNNLSNLPIKHSIASQYRNPAGEVVKVEAAETLSVPDATSAISTLRGQVTRREGDVGNFAIGLSEVSYLYYHQGESSALAWSHGVWMYVVSSWSLDSVNEFVADFPY